MSTILLALLTLSAPGEAQVNEQAGRAKPAKIEFQPRKPHQLRAAVRETLIRESKAKTDARRLAAVKDLIQLYGEVMLHQELAQRERLRLRTQLWSRLTKIKKEVERSLPAGSRAKTSSPRIRAVAGQKQPSYSATQDGSASSVKTASGGAAVTDFGEELVDLIQRTIAPESWDVNGGRGVIYFWRR